MLSWHVQNFVVIWPQVFEYQLNILTLKNWFRVENHQCNRLLTPSVGILQGGDLSLVSNLPISHCCSVASLPNILSGIRDGCWQMLPLDVQNEPIGNTFMTKCPSSSWFLSLEAYIAQDFKANQWISFVLLSLKSWQNATAFFVIIFLETVISVDFKN